MRPEIIQRIRGEKEEHGSIQVPLQLPIPEAEDREEEEVSVISRVIVIDM